MRKEVPVMLNCDSEFEAVATGGVPFGMGACLPLEVIKPAGPLMGAIAFARPRAFWATDVSGRRHQASDLRTGVSSAAAIGQPAQSKQNYPYTTRIAASGGTKGPHPAREPEPV
jgi:hypothetical protein